MKIYLKSLIFCIALPLGVGALAALITSGSMKIFETLGKPPLSPPGWLFPIAWSILYILMGIASYLVLHADKGDTAGAFRLYGAQLAVNFLWPILFFSLKLYSVAFLWLVLLWALVFFTWRRFRAISSAAGWLLVPYLAWVTFAGYLNFGIFLLN